MIQRLYALLTRPIAFDPKSLLRKVFGSRKAPDLDLGVAVQAYKDALAARVSQLATDPLWAPTLSREPGEGDYDLTNRATIGGFNPGIVSLAPGRYIEPAVLGPDFHRGSAVPRGLRPDGDTPPEPKFEYHNLPIIPRRFPFVDAVYPYIDPPSAPMGKPLRS